MIGLAGVAALVGIDIAGQPDELLGAAAILVAAVGYAIGPMLLERHLAGADMRAVMAASLGRGRDPHAVRPGRAAVVDAVARARSIVVLGFLCTAAAFVAYGSLIADVGPSKASVITYVNPVVAVALGVAVLGERPGAGAVAGLLLILAGSWLSTDGRTPPGLAA